MRFRFFFITYTIANLSLVAYGILALWKPVILLDTFSLLVYQFPEGATTAMNYLAALFRLLGFFNLILGVFGLILLRQYGISHQRWLVQVVIASSLLSYLGPIVFDNTVGNIGVFEIIEHILFVAMILSGLLMLRTREPAFSPRMTHEKEMIK